MKIKETILLILIWFSGIHGVFADQSPYQKVYRQPLTVVDGLVSNEVNCILQDSKGFMWFGTNNGLCRYDGYTFKSYKSNYLNPFFFTDNNILCLLEDKLNRLWIGTSFGLNMIDLNTGRITHFMDKSLLNSSINVIVMSFDNTVYFGTSTGLYYYNSKKNNFIKIKTDSRGVALHSDYVKSLFVDSKNYLWIGLWESGYVVYNLNMNLFVDYPYLKNKKDLIVNSFFEDIDHNIWLSTWDKYGVWKIENPHQITQSNLVNYHLPKRKKSTTFPVVYAIDQDRNTKNIILATSDGIQIIKQENQYKDDVFLDETNTIKISNDEIYALNIDRTGLIWYSVYGTGIGALSSGRAQFEQYNLSKYIDEDNSLSSITAIYEDEKGLLWLGIKSFVMGLFDRKEKSFVLYSNHPVLKNLPADANSIFCFFRPTKLDELWLGTRYEGLYVVKYKNGKINSVEKKEIINLSNKNLAIKKIINDSKTNTIWIATNKGLVRALYEPKLKDYIIQKDMAVENKLKGQIVNDIMLDNKRNLWVGTTKHGLYKFTFNKDLINEQQFCFENGGLNNNEIMSLFQDYKNRIWVGTKGGGLSLYNNNNGSFRFIDNMGLMPDDVINSIEEDNWGNIWLGTNNGLVCYNEDLPNDQKIRIFSGNEGVRINTFNPNTSFKNHKYELFFGATNGFVAFVPDRNENKSYTPTPVITGFSIANEPVDNMSQLDRDKISKKQVAYTDQLTLSYNQKNILIEFSALLYDNIAAIKYAYKLEGIDKDWVYVDSKKRFVNYNNLPSGKYTFKVKASNADGVWCEQPASLTIRIKLPPWQTPYAFIGYSLFLFIIALFIYRFVRKQLELKRMLVIEQIERDKSEEVHQAKLKFFTNISHEFFTPITILKCVIDGLIIRYPDDSHQILTMKTNLNRLVKLLEQIMEFRKVETKNLKLKLSQIELVSFINKLCHIDFAPLSEQKNISLEFSSSCETITGFIDIDKLDKIMYNLLSNAFKYNKDGGSVHVSLKLLNINNRRNIFISVADTGYGMSKEVKENVFKRFYEGNFRDFKVKSIGVGLSLTFDLVKFHHGKITVESEEEVGSVFYVTLPIDKEDYEGNEVFFTTDTLNSENKQLNSTVISDVEEQEKMNVLLVEDNIDLLTLMSDTLSNEFNIFKAENGEIAWSLLSVNDVNIVVTDVFMPVMDGLELTQKMKSVVEFSHIPVIMLSARQEVEHKVEGFDAGADSYVTKPFEMPALIANIKSLIKNRQMLASSFSVDNSLIDISKYVYNKTDKEFLEKVFKIIENNVLHNDFSTNDLYIEIGMSQSSFYRKLNSLLNISPSDLIRKVKIQVACRLLLERNLTVAEIAYDLGFSEPKYFSSIFKKEIGMNPTEYVRKMQENIENK